MTSVQRRRDLGMYQGQGILRSLGEEIRIARVAAGLSQNEVGYAAGISGAHVGRLERAVTPSASVTLYAVLFSVLGMRLSARPYLQGPPIRDIAHARLLERLRRRLHTDLRFRTEVPIGLPGDLRAWDAEIATRDGRCSVEAETALRDLQASDRRIALKMADTGVELVVLLVSDTRRNRRVLREFRELVASRYPLSTRQVMAALRHGRLPSQSGVVML